MQMKFANRDELAWAKGELAYMVGDTIDMAIQKAIEAGFRPGSNGYAAFITAFSRQVRNRRGVRVETTKQHSEGIGSNTVIREVTTAQPARES